MLQVYNTLKNKKEKFVPLDPKGKKVNMYVCGVTVYDYCHVGHARAYVAFDMIRRYLVHSGYDVNYIQNFTDIDDKIIKRAQETNKEIKEVTDEFTQAYIDDIEKSLGVQQADSNPRATENIPGMIELIEALIKKGHAYEVEGEVFFKVSSFKDYGKLSKRNLEDMQAGARVEVDKKKEDPLDFVLWKPSKEGEPFWDSPWGKGRPGWHIECSVMSLKEAGIDTLDIHGGGQDLIFPHHENEIAQSEAYTSKQFARYWLHNGFVTIDKEKMSKSLGNFFTVRDVLKKYSPEVIRFFLLSTHYRSPIDFSDKQLDEAKKGLERLYNAINNPLLTIDKSGTVKTLKKFEDSFFHFMDDDFNSAGAIGALFNIASFANGQQSKEPAKKLKELGKILGILQKEKEEVLLSEEIDGLIKKRETARKNKDFAGADKIRDDLLAQGIILKDTPEGVVWEKK